MKHSDNPEKIRIKAPLWKWLVIILLVIGMPLLFSFYRAAQTQQVVTQINSSNP